MSQSRPPEPDRPDDPGPPDDPGDPAEDPNNPYRFGLPDHPIAPEYAPPGYVPPPPQQQQPPPPPPFGDYGHRSPYPPGPPFPPGGQYPPGPPQQQHPRRTGKPITALICGIASILLCWTTLFDLIPIVAGIVVGSLGAADARRRGDVSARRMAVAGIVCAIVGAVLAVIVIIYVYNRVKSCLDLPSGSAAQRECVRDKL